MSHPVVNPPAVKNAGSRLGAEDVVERALEWFLDGRRIDMQQLASELGIGRATLYRWWGSKERLTGEVVWRIMHDAIRRLESRGRGTPDQRLVRDLDRLAATVRTFEPLAQFVSQDPEHALRVLTSDHSVTQRHAIDWVAGRLRAIPGIDHGIGIDDLAYTIIRIVESFVWTDMITGDPPRPERAAEMVALLISAAMQPSSNREKR